MRKEARVIGRFSGTEEGPLLIAFGAIHGNEPAGTQAIDLIVKMLEVEPITNPDFTYRGSFLGLVGNVKAFRRNKRFIKKDLNRQWRKQFVDEIMKKDPSELKDEEREIREILELIDAEIHRLKPTKVIVLDLHTTSSHGGIFSIPSDDPESFKIALELNAPVIKGMMQGIKGTTLHYFNTENMGYETVGITFESGQHQDPLSVNRAIAAITNCMRSIGAVDAEDVENRHDIILQEYSNGLPKVVELIRRHPVENEDKFRMCSGYKNFQTVHTGEHLAYDKQGPIFSDHNAFILMPLYQEQGEDGFFLVKKVEGF